MNIHGHGSVSGAKPVNAIQPIARQGVAREKTLGEVPSAPKEPSGPSGSGTSRLEAYSEKLTQRFDAALASKDLTPRQRQALEKERESFQSMMSRFEHAYLTGPESAKKDAAQGMQKLLQHFGKSVNHIFSGGTPGDPSTAPGRVDPNVGPERSSGRTSGIDIVG